jgi:endonuclease/exonuclease/phosphatase (EEP) superfamily protein YafD
MILVALPALAIAALTVMGFFGAWWWPLDLLAAFRPQYMVTATVLGLVLVLVRWRRIGAIALAAAVANAVVVVPLYFAPAVPGVRTGDRLLVMSFNVKADVSLFEQLVALIERNDPDLVFLHEATPGWEERMAGAGLEYDVVSTRNPGVRFGTLVLAPTGSRVEGFGFAEAEPRAVEVEVQTASGPVTFLGIHPLSPTEERRADLRDAQLAYVGEWASAVEGRVVVVGDFNATPWSSAFRRLVRTSGLENSQRGFGVQASFPANLNPVLRVPIDHLLYSEGLAVVDRRLGPSLGSDHYPLLVSLALVG